MQTLNVEKSPREDSSPVQVVVCKAPPPAQQTNCKIERQYHQGPDEVHRVAFRNRTVSENEQYCNRSISLKLLFTPLSKFQTPKLLRPSAGSVVNIVET